MNRAPSILALLALLVLMSVSTSLAQVTTPDSTKKQDTVIYVPTMEQRPAGDVTNAVDLEKHLIQNPTGALFKSMLIPGWGQIGNKRAIKAGIFIGLETWFGYEAVKYGRQAHDVRAAYNAATDSTIKLSIYSRYQDRRSSRNKYIWFFGLTTFVSMFDAYVDAHLSGSPTDARNDQFSFDLVPDSRGGASALLAFRF